MKDIVFSTKSALIAQGVQKGDTIVVIAESSAAYACLICASWSIGCIVAPLSTRYPQAITDDLILKLNPQLVISDQIDLLPNRICLYTLCPYTSNSFHGVGFADLNLDLDCIANIIFSSGSSGQPKGIVHSLSNHYYSALGAHSQIPFSCHDTWGAMLPFCHISGLSLIMRSLLHGGSLLFPTDGEIEVKYLDQLTHISLVPTQLIRLIADGANRGILSHFCAILVGGSSVSSELRAKCHNFGLPLYTTYGSSEMSSQISTTREGRAVVENNSGNVLPHREVHIAPSGEVLVRGKTLFQGYWQNGKVTTDCDLQGWYHTGDRGAISTGGELIIKGRIDLMFISGGENIYPEEIEQALEKHPMIDKAVVVARDSEEFGQRPIAYVKFTDGAVDGADIKSFMKNQLSGFKVPDKFLQWPSDIPDTLKLNRSHFDNLTI